jgi:NADH-quinone oxidoreductase subunit N
MNLGAFAVVAMVRNATYSEQIGDYAGLWARLPLVCGGMAVCCLSLVGIWPAGGFIGKFMVFAASLKAGWVSPVMWALVGVGALNTVWSLFYYARVLKSMYLDSPSHPERVAEINSSRAADALVLAFAVPVLLLGVFVEPVSRVTAFVAQAFAG